MKRQATTTVCVPFEVEGSENEIYEGSALCRVTPGTHDSYHPLYGWSPGDGPVVEVLDVVVGGVKVTEHGVEKTLVDPKEVLRMIVTRLLEDNRKLQNDALEAAREEFEGMMGH